MIKTMEHFVVAVIAAAVLWLSIASWAVAWLMMIVVPAAVGIGVIYLQVQNKKNREKIWKLIIGYKRFWLPALILSSLTTGLLLFASWTGWCLPLIHIGGRGTPWMFLWLWSSVFWAVTLIIGACYLSKSFRDDVVVAIFNWIRFGGFWKFWSMENGPANSLMWLAAILIASAILYGPPSSKIDWEQRAWDIQQASVKGQSAVVSQPGFGTFLAETFFGRGATTEPKDKTKTVVNRVSNALIEREVITSSGLELVKEPGPRYVRGWFWVKMSLFAVVLAVIGLMLSRRDEAADWIESLVAKVKDKKEQAKVVAGNVADNVAEAAGAAATVAATTIASTQKTGDTAFSKLFASDLLSDITVKAGPWIAGFLRNFKK